MKKQILTMLIALLALPVFAGTKLTSGTLSELLSAKNVPVSVNWDNAIYGKAGTLDDFISTATRNDNWEEQSLDYFIHEVNSKVAEYGIRIVPETKSEGAKFRIEIVVLTISKGGDIKGEIVVKPIDSNEQISTITFSSDDSDDNDKIAFKDQFKSIGGSLGKLLAKQLKSASK